MRDTPPQVITASAEPVRLFKSDFWEFFTHISPVTVLVIWVPVIGAFVAAGIRARGGADAWPRLAGGLAAGLALWTLAEYLLHRFAFHYRARSARGRRLVFLIHGIHHLQPQCKTRLVMPPVISVPLGLAFYGLFAGTVGRLPGGAAWVPPLFAGFLAGYVVYDMTHYAVHHFRPRGPIARALRQNHMRHHFGDPELRFGISTTLWDRVFGTHPRG